MTSKRGIVNTSQLTLDLSSAIRWIELIAVLKVFDVKSSHLNSPSAPEVNLVERISKHSLVSRRL